MKAITLKEVANSCGGKLFGDESIKINSIVTDSRKVKNGTLFAAIKGERADGHEFMKSCFEAGALCMLCEKAPDFDTPYILVESTLIALKKIAKYYRSLFSIPFIGVSGSVGKTSTKEMIASVLSEKFSVHKTSGNFNNELGVPLTLFELEEHHEVAVIEMGISGFSEMTRLSEMVKPDICVITNIGYCHLENLKDLDGVLKAKTEMFANMNEGGKIFLNGDDEKLYSVKSYKDTVPTFYGLLDRNDCYADEIKDDTTSISGKIHLKTMEFSATVPAMGRHMLQNAVCAAAIGEMLGLTADEIKSGIENFSNVGSRSRVIDTSFLTVIDDCYNANPTSVKASIKSLSQFSSRKVAVIGDMKELGENENTLHKEVAEFIISNGIDKLICAGPLCENMKAVSSDIVHFDTTDECAENISKYLKKGDTVLVKASHSMQFEKVVEKIKEIN